MTKIMFGLVFCFVFTLTSVAKDETKYPTLKQMESSLKALGNRSNASVYSIGKCESGKDIYVLQVGESGKPAVFVIANLAGNLPNATQGALAMAEQELDSPSSSYTWYYIPMANPEAYQQYWDGAEVCVLGNGQKVDHDNDGVCGEDFAEDLNNDGFITMMRKKTPEGAYVCNSKDERLLSKKNSSKGEVGVYSYYREGIDNDEDGKYNEDSKTGIVVNKNFSQEFVYFDKASGRYPGEAPEAFSIMKFVSSHPEIALAISLDKTETLQEFKESKDKNGLNLSKIKPTGRLLSMLSLDAKKMYSIDELVSIASDKYPGSNISSEDILSLLSKKPETKLYLNDYNLYSTLSKEYQAELAKQGATGNRLQALAMQPGSFEKWVYHHRGIPVLAKCLYRPMLPAKADSTNLEFGMLAVADSIQDGFVSWTAYKHTQLGDVEIGGFTNRYWTPSAEEASTISKPQTEWLAKSTEYLPKLEIASQKTTSLGKDIVRIELIVKNSGKMSYPLDMGVRNKEVPAISVVLDQTKATYLEGKSRTSITKLKAQESKKITWLVQTNGAKNLDVTLSAPSLFPVIAKIQL